MTLEKTSNRKAILVSPRDDRMGILSCALLEPALDKWVKERYIRLIFCLRARSLSQGSKS